MQVQVIVFQTIHSTVDEIRDYSTTHDIDRLYSNIGTITNEKELSIILRLISYNEERAYNYFIYRGQRLIHKPVVEYSSITGENIITHSKKFVKKYLNMHDLYARDQAVLSDEQKTTREYRPYAVVVLIDGQYRGHVYCWQIKSVMNIMGIRGSLFHFIDRKISIAETLLFAIRQWAVNKFINVEYLRTVSPMQVMRRISKSIGMKSLYTLENMDWLDRDGYIGNGPVTSEEEAADRSRDGIHCVAKLFVNEIKINVIDRTT
jgi:hypothetical protein